MKSAIMVQGTGSGVGKSVMVAALCRIFSRRGFRVSPFKAQNMALNSHVTKTGGEIGRSTAVQAFAAGIEPLTEMNPILLKPKGDTTSQLIVMGKPVRDVTAADYFGENSRLIRLKMTPVKKAWNYISSKFEIVVIEGAGSPAEINLRKRDIVNMRTARMAGAPVILVADIDRGGAFASLVGTFALLLPSEKKRIKAFLLNKFRGDPTLLKSAMDETTKRTRVPFLGIIPYKHGLDIQEEDAVPSRIQGSASPDVRIGIIYLPHISNFTDFDPLAWEPGAQLNYVMSPAELSGMDAIILPGTKNTSADLLHLQQSGLAAEIKKSASAGTPIIGICGGYQMMGLSIEDKGRIEGHKESLDGLGLLPVKTYFSSGKILKQAIFRPSGIEPFLSDTSLNLAGYEIHHGRARVLKTGKCAFVTSDGRGGGWDGCVSADGKIFGCYLHDLFENDSFRRNFVNVLRKLKNLAPLDVPLVSASSRRERGFDQLANLVLENIDIKLLDRLAGLEDAMS